MKKLKAMRVKSFARDDYKEFPELALLLAGWICHKARWMSKVIYATKIILYKHKLESKGVDLLEDVQHEKLNYLALFYF